MSARNAKFLLVLLAGPVIAAFSPHAFQHSGPAAALAGESGNESDGGDSGGDDPSENGTIDCSIPDNADDTGCDTGDVGDDDGEDQRVPVQPVARPQPQQPAVQAPRQDLDSGPAPRGGVPTGAGGTAR